MTTKGIIAGTLVVQLLVAGAMRPAARAPEPAAGQGFGEALVCGGCVAGGIIIVASGGSAAVAITLATGGAAAVEAVTAAAACVYACANI